MIRGFKAAILILVLGFGLTAPSLCSARAAGPWLPALKATGSGRDCLLDLVLGDPAAARVVRLGEDCLFTSTGRPAAIKPGKKLSGVADPDMSIPITPGFDTISRAKCLDPSCISNDTMRMGAFASECVSP